MAGNGGGGAYLISPWREYKPTCQDTPHLSPGTFRNLLEQDVSEETDRRKQDWRAMWPTFCWSPDRNLSTLLSRGLQFLYKDWFVCPGISGFRAHFRRAIRVPETRELREFPAIWELSRIPGTRDFSGLRSTPGLGIRAKKLTSTNDFSNSSKKKSMWNRGDEKIDKMASNRYRYED